MPLRFRPRRPAPKRRVETRALAVEGLDAPLELRINPRATRLSLKLDPAHGGARVVVPPGVAEGQVRDFVLRHMGWLAPRLAAIPLRRPFEDGATVPFRGQPHSILHEPERRLAVRREEGVLRVGGEAAHLPRRVTDFLKRKAKGELAARSHAMAERLSVTIRAVTVRDTRSRWGSCSADGRLSYCWRLIMAPDWVIDYVAAHEVAHRIEMNHGPRFWALVESLDPNVAAARAWLKAEGGRLHLYG